MTDEEYIAAWRRGELQVIWSRNPKLLKLLEDYSPEWPYEHDLRNGREED